MYTPLRCHGHHTLLTGVDAPEALLERARDLGMPALALADVDSMAGLVDLIQAAQAQPEVHPSGAPPVRPIIAAELSDAGDRAGRVLALVENETGYRNLCRLVSARRIGFDPGAALPEDPDERDDEHARRRTGPEAFDLIESVIEHQDGLFLLADHPRLLVGLFGRVAARRLFALLSPAAPGLGGLRDPRTLTPARRDSHRAADRSSHGAGIRNTHRAGDPDRVRALDTQLDPSDDLSAKTPPPARPAPADALLDAARATGAALVIAPDVYFVSPRGEEDHRVRVAIRHNALLQDLPEEWIAARPAHLLGARELNALIADVPDVAGAWPLDAETELAPGASAVHPGLRRTQAIADLCRYVPVLGGVLFPEVKLDAGETAYSKLCALALDGARLRFQPMRPEVLRRLEHELDTIQRLGYAPYFLLVRDIAGFAEDQGIPHVGRGSAADSLVAYCLQLTDADPFRYGLPFERFLNPSRRDRPDIDLDFCWKRRDEVLDHVFERFGTERTAMICTLNRFGLRSAFREAGLVHGIPPAEIGPWSSRLPMYAALGPAGEEEAAPHDGSAEGGEKRRHGRNREAPKAVSGVGPTLGPGGGGLVAPRDGQALQAPLTEAPPSEAEQEAHTASSNTASSHTASTSEPESGFSAPSRPARPPIQPNAPIPAHIRDNPIVHTLQRLPEARGFPFDDERFVRTLVAAAALLDTPRHFGLHPGGVVVAPGRITDVVACQPSAKGPVVTQLDKNGVEAIGLVKMDLLGNRALSTLDDCVRLLREQGLDIDPADAPEEDADTARTLGQGRTLGCFQIESPGMRHLLLQMQARGMDDVIQAVALIRPGPAGSGMKDAYIRRVHGLEDPRAPHPSLDGVLRDTHGVMLYQEDVMQTAAKLAGMDLAEADRLRRALQKRRFEELVPLQRRFLDGAAGQGVSAEDAQAVWDLIANFASFAFCKAHAVTYGRIAYRAAWLKTHFPAAFLTAFLLNETGYYPTRVYIEEARRLGVRILGPEVNKSGAHFQLERGSGGTGPLGLRTGFATVKGLTGTTLEALLAARESQGPFLSLPDFLERTGARTDETETLIRCGAFDAFDRTRPELAWRLQLLRAPARRVPAGSGLDLGRLAACRENPIEAARSRTGGWNGRGLGVEAEVLEPGRTASLFPDPPSQAVVLPGLPDPSPLERGRDEFELLGFTLQDHPVALFPCPGETRLAARGRHTAAPAHGRFHSQANALEPVNPIPCGKLDDFVGARVTLRGWPAATRRARTENGDLMRFLTLEDESGLAEAVLFPDVYASDGERITFDAVLLITGTVEARMGASALQVERVW
tara:strand:- start:35965 stop:39912 length:3948 start_codon:yes stop_codon:yes gene_type:complete